MRAHLQVLLALGRCHGDIMIANEAVETVETAAKIPECVKMTAEVIMFMYVCIYVFHMFVFVFVYACMYVIMLMFVFMYVCM